MSQNLVKTRPSTGKRWKFWCMVTGGILVVTIFPIFTFVSLALFPLPYSAITNWLSDLGNSVYSPGGAIWYNTGCILTGVALVPFFIGLNMFTLEEKWKKNVLVILQSFGLVQAFALVMIGVFSEDYPEQHITWSSIFFVVNMLVQIIASISLLHHPLFSKAIAAYGFATSAINVLFVVTLGESPAVEWMTVFTALGFVALAVTNTIVKFREK
ncbi:MAG: hypothetical protein Q6373_003980 [Candidatus Sigynarchaeota archaeon]